MMRLKKGDFSRWWFLNCNKTKSPLRGEPVRKAFKSKYGNLRLYAA